MHDALTACSSIISSKDPGLKDLRLAHARSCMTSQPANLEAAALQLLMAGDTKGAALALSRIGGGCSLAAVASACEICLLRLVQLEGDHTVRCRPWRGFKAKKGWEELPLFTRRNENAGMDLIRPVLHRGLLIHQEGVIQRVRMSSRERKKRPQT